ncbi:hypothetical protein BAE42_07510 [Mesorhizobium loti]|uniref:Uncharacterized protein n=1 Tax=Rhizobium loti TaxID=381 RepID=A0A1A5ID03_RHILI|nr:hypothetical protein BAE41_17860 [Mesorhizobium loti]OBP75417.1 hypothetical protein BAE42_07510 [Mesorhizobium loti]OBP76831.1 hypothetical protein BAE39_12180 [Mesorhizobium loti]OBP86472.1 hypothetical protein BAE38_17870 [Mesorhizobium loti]OBP90770.1 hypothetical protein BAE40_18440 [Mesorhizobium loti]
MTCSLVQDERVVVGPLMISYLPKVSHVHLLAADFASVEIILFMCRGAIMSSARDGRAKVG